MEVLTLLRKCQGKDCNFHGHSRETPDLNCDAWQEISQVQ